MVDCPFLEVCWSTIYLFSYFRYWLDWNTVESWLYGSSWRMLPFGLIIAVIHDEIHVSATLMAMTTAARGIPPKSSIGGCNWAMTSVDFPLALKSCVECLKSFWTRRQFCTIF
jgi:hypothetical protein